MHMTYEPNSQQGRGNFSSRPRDDSGAGDGVRRQAEETFDETREQAASGLDSIVGAAAAAAEDLREHNQEGLSRYVSEIADSVASLATSLRHKSVDELIHDVGAIARRNPTLFLAGSLAVGLGVGRFARSSSKHQRDKSDYGENDNRADMDEDYPRNLSGDAYPERAENDDYQQVTEEDYLADDFAFAGGEDIDLEKEEFGGSNNRFDGRREDVTSRRTTRDSSTGNTNQPIGGDFYE